VQIPLQISRQRLEHFSHLVRIWTGRQDIFLRTAEFGSRDHFHGLGYLTCIFDGYDPLFDAFKASHVSTVLV